MDDTDLESFDKFVERHWGNKQKQTVLASSVATQAEGEEKPKRRRTKTDKQV